MWNKIINLTKTTWARLTFRGTPSPKCWVFSSVHNQTFNYNSSYLFLHVKENCPDIHPYYVVNDDKLRTELEEKYGKGYFINTKSLSGIRKVLSCKVWFTSTAPPLYGMGFRKDYVIINLWHGVPLKKIGMEQGNLSRFTRKYYKYLFADNYEAVVTTSEELKPMMSKSFLVDQDRIKVWGQPRNDMLFEKKDARTEFKRIFETQAAVEIQTESGLQEVKTAQTAMPDFRKAVLYAPTFRDDKITRLFPFQDFDVEELVEWLEQQKLFLCVRLHLYDQSGYAWMKELDRPGSRIRLMNEDRAGDVMEVLNCFDLLITDYSSIYIDYLLTGKPIVFLPYDREEYLKDRGMNFDYDEATPGPKPKTFQEFLNSVYELLYNHDDYVCQRAQINEFFNEVQKPCCAEICSQVRKILDWRVENEEGNHIRNI